MQVVVATEQGSLNLFNNLEFRGVVASVPPGGSAIYVLAAFSKGFITGGGNGMLRIYERSDDPEEFFKCLKVSAYGSFYCWGTRSDVYQWRVEDLEKLGENMSGDRT